MKVIYIFSTIVLLCCATMAKAGPPGTLGKDLLADDHRAETILGTAKNLRFGCPLGNLRLLKKGKIKLRNLSLAQGSGLIRAAPIMEKAKSQLDRALKTRHQIDRSEAATFLTRYAWFCAAYRCYNRGYPIKRFRKLINEALALDHENPQALLMRAWLSYQLHSREILKPWPGGKPPGGHLEILMSDQAQRKVVRMVQNVLRVDPGNFEAWDIRWQLVNNGTSKPIPVETGVKIWMGMLRTAKNADLFYYGFNKSCVFGKYGLVHTARVSLSWYPKYYEKFYGHPPRFVKRKQPGG